MLQPVYDNVLVEVDCEWKSEHVTKSGIVGISFENDIDRSVGAQRKGVVINVPRATSDHYLVKNIQETIQIGDVIYFHFNSILPDSCVDIEGKAYYIVHMESIFCIVRNDQIIMYGGRVLTEPVYDADVVTLDGMKVRQTKSGIISEINVGHNLKIARLTHIGLPLKGNELLDVEIGDTVYYSKDADFENEIEGKTYFCMTQEDLLMSESR